MNGSDDPGLRRREFVREGFRRLLRPIARAVGDRVERIRIPPALSEAEERPNGSRGGARILRPPGAIREDLFAERCRRSGRCVEACPVGAIRPVAIRDPALHGTPAIDPRVQACIICEDLSCMKACPSGALAVLPRARIEMGTAEVDLDRCLRSSGDACRLCLERCPMGRAAIEIPDHEGPVAVKPEGCAGCGACEMVCPVDPPAITVRSSG